MFIKVTCQQCGKEFEVRQCYYKRGGGKFCSPACGYENKRKQVKFNCEICGKEVSQRLSDYKKGKGHHFCSKICTGKWVSENLTGENSYLHGKKQSKEHVEKRVSKTSGENHYNWKNGKTIHQGYVYITLDGRRGYEHTLVAEKALGRRMKKGEVVHHINGNRSDNRNKNLLICDKSYHGWFEKRMAQLYKEEHFAHI